MRLRKFYKQLERVGKVARVDLSDGNEKGIVITFPDDLSQNYCPLTAVAFVELGLKFGIENFDKAAQALGIGNEGSNIAYAADGDGNSICRPNRAARVKRIRRAMFRRLRLGGG
jgi:hypothetical protein